MIERNPRIETARFVTGDLGVYFVYTAGVAGEEFLKELQRGKLLASKCDDCGTTYCPPRIFCEDCFAEIHDRREVPGTGVVETLTRLGVDAEGRTIEPESVAAIRLDGTDSTMLHRVTGQGLAIGTRVEPVWASKRVGSILDIEHFRAVSAARPSGRVRGAEAETNGKRLGAQRRTVAAKGR